MASVTRKDHEPPAVTSRGWRYHHLGMYVFGFETSPYGIEWMRFDPDSPISELIRTVPHIAFEVDDLDVAIVGKELLGDVSEPSAGMRVAMIVDNGAPVELLEFRKRSD